MSAGRGRLSLKRHAFGVHGTNNQTRFLVDRCGHRDLTPTSDGVGLVDKLVTSSRSAHA
jgi:hypothetical protein